MVWPLHRALLEQFHGFWMFLEGVPRLFPCPRLNHGPHSIGGARLLIRTAVATVASISSTHEALPHH